MNSPYADIIHLPHHVSQNHPQMPMLDRAAQFAPFAALTGYEAAVGETARLTAERRELDAQEAEELNRRLAALIANLPDRPEATIEYFVPDDRKSGAGNLAARMLPSRGGCGIFPFRRRRWSWRTGRSSVLRILPRFLDFSLKYE